MKIDRKQQIIAFVKQKNEVSAKEIVDLLGITESAVFRHLKTLIENDELAKTGTPPRVFYFINPKKILPQLPTLPDAQKSVIEFNFFMVTPQGNMLSGINAFGQWCADRNLDPIKTASEYMAIWEKYHAYKKDGLIDGKEKFKSAFAEIYLDDIYYLDFYALERFGKTKLGWLLLYAKQTQNKKMMEQIGTLAKPIINDLIQTKNIDAVGFIPATVKRKIQFQKELERILHLPLPKINLVKARNAVAVPQKSLAKLEDRVVNARATIFVDDDRQHKNILLIDDAVGSGATLNETAKKIKDKKLCAGKIIGLALTGSFKGFDVISEI